MTEEEITLWLKIEAAVSKMAYEELLRLRAKYEDDHINETATGIRCAIDYIFDNYDLTPKAKEDKDARRTE